MNGFKVVRGRVVEVEVVSSEETSAWRQAAWACKLLGGFVLGCGACLLAGAEVARWVLA